MATHPVFLPGVSPWTEEPSGLQSMGSQRVRHNWVTKHSTAQHVRFYFKKREMTNRDNMFAPHIIDEVSFPNM